MPTTPDQKLSLEKRPAVEPRLPLIGQSLQSLQKCRLTLFIAPSGYGKSTLLERMAEQLALQNSNVISINAQQSSQYDDYLANALLSKLTNDNSHLREEASLPQLPGIIHSLDSPVYILIDNYSQKHTESVKHLVETLLSIKTDFLHIAMCCSAEPGFAYSKLMLSGDAVVFNTGDLSLRQADIRLFLESHVKSMPIDPQTIDTIYQRTEGWPVAVQLAAVLLNQYGDTHFLEQFSGQDQFLTSFFNEHVLPQTPEPLMQFAAQAALFDDFSIDQINEALDTSTARENIFELNQRKLFITSLDRNQTRFRFHPMFRDFLATTKWQPNKKQSRAIYQAAALWAEEQNLTINAIEYALSASDFTLAKRLIVQSAQIIVRDQGLPPKLIQWCQRIPADNSPTAIYMNFWLAWSLTFSHQLELAERNILKLEQQLARTRSLGKEERFLLEGQIWGLKITLRVYQDQGEWCFKQSELWLKKYQDIADPYDVALAFSVRFVSAFLLLNQHEAHASIVSAKEKLAGLNSPYGTMWLQTLDGISEMEFGNYQVAHKILTRAHDQYLTFEEQVSPIVSTIALLLAKTSYEMGDMTSAENHLREGKAHIHDHGLTETAIAGIFVETKLAQQNSFSDALSALKNAEFTAGHHSPRLTFLIRKLKTELLIQNGQVELAEREARLAGVRINDEDGIEMKNVTSPLIETEKVRLGITLLYAKNRHKSALKEIKKLLEKPQTSQRPLFHTECLIIHSALLATNQEKKLSGRQLSKALKKAVENGFYQTFIDLKLFTIPAIKELRKQRQDSNILPEDDLMERISLALGLATKKTGPDNSEDLSLSARETELLELLKSPLSIQGIADYVFLSKATVKWHLNNIYKKLGVNNRTGALSVAKSKGLIY
ncbi:MAG: AAA family ATPase [Pseudomonadales bacterium]|nr:AAA family ATPase [Pseudomonadales bacterium]